MFLKKLYQQWRLMFYFIILLLAAQFFFMYKAVETVPFFLFNMYSTKQLPADTTHRTIVYLNGNRFDASSLTGREKETLFGSLSFFRRLKKNNFMATDSGTISKRLKGNLPASWYPTAVDRLANQKISDNIFFKWWQDIFPGYPGSRSIRFPSSSVLLYGNPLFT